MQHYYIFQCRLSYTHSGFIPRFTIVIVIQLSSICGHGQDKRDAAATTITAISNSAKGLPRLSAIASSCCHYCHSNSLFSPFSLLPSPSYGSYHSRRKIILDCVERRYIYIDIISSRFKYVGFMPCVFARRAAVRV